MGGVVPSRIMVYYNNNDYSKLLNLELDHLHHEWYIKLCLTYCIGYIHQGVVSALVGVASGALVGEGFLHWWGHWWGEGFFIGGGGCLHWWGLHQLVGVASGRVSALVGLASGEVFHTGGGSNKEGFPHWWG